MALNLLGYIDPGTGALMLQVLAAGILTAGVVARKVVIRPLALFRQALSGKAAR